ncbi:MAG: hypothetical protein OXJ37_21215 [Bryobacterales bacterium]|nr:hypothetical protein [Bryobacterales bacterium]MDE0264937.1 hypothetical protein [Bryobacterales bacterium]MDE0624072.1 hypothetical protein [Bryobacterales bacterium]
MKSLKLHLAFAFAALAVASAAQSARAQVPQVAVDIPDGVPLRVAAQDFSDSEFEVRGGAIVIHLSGSLHFRHDGAEPVRAIALRVAAGEETLGGRATVTMPSLHATSGESFEVPFNLRLVRPLSAGQGPAVRIEPDAVLFASLAAVGPDRLDSIRKLTVLEMEARRDREHFLALWQRGGKPALTAAMQASLRRQAARPRLEVRLAGQGPATVAASEPIREMEIAVVNQPDAPLILESGSARVRGSISDAPQFLLRSRGGRAVRHFDIGWLVRDGDGSLYSVGSAPVTARASVAGPQAQETTGEGRFLIQPASGGEPSIDAMLAYLRSAQFDDGAVWVPSRETLEVSRLAEAVPVSAEEQRLSQLYRERGADAIAEELRKFTQSDQR